MGVRALLVTALLTAAVGYYLYTPLPDAIQEPWKLLAVDATLRTMMHLVRNDRCCLLSDRSVCFKQKND